MMEKLLKVFVGFILTLFLNLPVQAQINALGGDVPFPWGTEAPFPWDDIEGAWVAEEGLEKYYFYIRVVNEDPSGSQVISMLQYNLENMKIIAEGGGFAYSYNKILRVAMNTYGDKNNYIAIIRAYEYIRNDEKNRAMVMTIRFFEKSEKEDIHLILKKVSTNSSELL